jgi:predicted NBD/HSP70 family sugar kinase
MCALAAEPDSRARINDWRVVRLICAQGPQSRLEIGRRLGLSQPTVTKAVASLLRARLLEEFEENSGPAGVGRPPRKLRLATATAQILGVMIAPSRCWVVASGLDGTLAEDRMRQLKTPDRYRDLIDGIVGLARELMERNPVPTLGIGLCVPGLLDPRTQQLALSANVHCLDGQRPAEDVGERLGIAAVTLPAKHALSLAESHFGAMPDRDDFLMLDFSTGVSMSAVTNGQLIRGKSGFAGEVGHMTVHPDGPPCGCGNRGCLETFVSDPAIAAKVGARLGRPLDIDRVVALYDADPSALDREVADILEYLPIALAALINALNPASLYLHGRLFDLGDDLIPRVLEATRRRALGPSFSECEIRRTRGNKRQGALAAIRQHLIDSLAATPQENPIY